MTPVAPAGLQNAPGCTTLPPAGGAVERCGGGCVDRGAVAAVLPYPRGYRVRLASPTHRESHMKLKDETQAEEILQRLRRAEGQIGGIIRMIESGRDCNCLLYTSPSPRD